MSKLIVIIIMLLLFSACATSSFITSTNLQDSKEVQVAFEKARKEMEVLYELSSTGRINTKGGYIQWDKRGATLFLKK